MELKKLFEISMDDLVKLKKDLKEDLSMVEQAFQMRKKNGEQPTSRPKKKKTVENKPAEREITKDENHVWQ